ncbi:hypothetical protein C1752_03704 [Acaryochloris thomasi RCC1774]|uniref:G domain-containing protein n=1 Tax=Acaryochloris thomasi RCC1774 TaxID=1764569 RepID=A0A2W1JV61_9CYAN|nr:GTPase [Acaryochloris thomasi]PZD72387.1 hypothetical protein C1752_03704 [Acaryochloris thomasi RCC1774]
MTQDAEHKPENSLPKNEGKNRWRLPKSFPQDWLKNARGLLSPLQQAQELVSRWFSVSDQDMAAILEQIRAELPTTEVLMIGKPQTGKSSIVRGLTGVSAEIVGQGFRPHTQHTQNYAYPTEDLPLLIFTDTIGLGEGGNEADELADELNKVLPKDVGQASRVIILTVKATDFATDFLQQLMMRIRGAHPEIPCLLAITCLHDLYPTDHHPAYPPTYPELQRAVTALKEQFSEICDRTTLIDFTLEEDGFTPVFYGLDAFANELAELLPAAESQMIHQLLEQTEGGDEIGQLYRDAGRRYILPFSMMAATLAAVPLPLATMPVLTGLQVTLVSLLGQLYGQRLSFSQAGGVASAIAGGFLAQLIGRELIKFIPGIGSVVAASWAAAYTWALGEGACVYFGDLMGGKTPDPQKIKQTMKKSFQEAQKRFRDSVRSQKS